MCHLLRRRVVPLLLLLGVVLQLAVCGAEPLFFAFDNGLGRGELTPVQQADLLKRLGYQGIGYTGTLLLAERQRACAAAGIAIANIYTACTAGATPSCAPGLLDALPLLAHSSTAIWLTVQGSGDDAAVDAAVRLVAEPARAQGITVALYPHHGLRIATAMQALEVVNRLALPTLGLTINLCHELRAGNEARLPEIIRACAPVLRFVSINGAEHDGDWSRLIKPLGEGAVDVLGFLRTLKTVGYAGPIGLQCYNIPGNQEQHLAASLATWKRYQAALALP